jgi:hypothetical protein
LDIKEFRETWGSTPSQVPTLEVDEWIESISKEPNDFWESLLVLQKTISPIPSKSIWQKQYDFYHDCVLRHLESNPAFIFVEETGFSQIWTYKKLQRIINFQVKHWQKQGAKPGQCVALVMPLGPYFYIALLTALRLGLTICYLPTSSPLLGSKHLLSLLDQINPHLIVAQQTSFVTKEKHKNILQMEEFGEDDENCEPASYAYESNQIMQISIALDRQQPFACTPLDAQTTYLHALRDGLLALNLKPGMTNTTAGSCPLRTQPCTTLMSLLSGATFVHFPLEALEKEPLLLKNEKIHLMEISSALQKLWSKYPGVPSKQLKGYYKSPFLNHSSSWQSFLELNNLEEVPSFSLLLDNSYGGSVLFSKPSTKTQHLYLKPSLGVPLVLKELNSSNEVSLRGCGFLDIPCKTGEEIPSNLILSQIDKNYLLSSTLTPCREGVTVPLEKIEETVAQLSFVESCILYAVPKMGEVAMYQLVLLVFVDPLKNDISEKMQQEWTEQISQQLINGVGDYFLTDRVEYYPLVPKMSGSKPDRIWCEEQYRSGFLNQKRQQQLYQALSILKKLSQVSVKK